MASKPKTRPYPKGKAGTFDISIEGLEKMEDRLRRQGRTDEADELSAEIARKRMEDIQGPQADVDFSQLGMRGRDVTPRPAKVDTRPSQDPEYRAKKRDRRQLDDTVVMNGNMSAARRRQVVIPALTKLGYTPEQARKIALAAPLNTSMYDRDAVNTALRYAYGITPDQIGKLDPNSIERAMAPDPLPMPPPARRALAAADFRDNPARGSFGALRRSKDTMASRFMDWWNPIADSIGERPVPTGLGGLFLANLLFLAVIVPANSQGVPRLQLLFAALSGRLKWANGVGIPTKQEVPNSPLIAAVSGMAVAGEEIAQSIGSVAGVLGGASQAASQVGQAAQALAPGIERAILGGAAGTLLPGIGNLVGGMLSSGSGPGLNTAALPPKPPITVI